MANAVRIGCLLSLMVLYFLSNSVASSARGGSQGDSWTRRRRFSVLARHQRLAGDEGRETDYDSPLRRKRDSAVNGGGDAEFNGERGVDGVKSVDRIGDLNNSEFLNDEGNTQQQQQQPISNDDEVATKRKWSENNVRIWGKRKWSSKGLHMWGKRQEDALQGASAERPIDDGGKENGVMNWPKLQRNQVNGLENDGQDTKKRQRWAKNNLKIWGKRNVETELNAEDLEEARMKTLGSPAAEVEHSEGVQRASRYGNRISSYLQKRNNPSSYGVEQKWGKKGWANNNVRIWG